MRKRLFTVLLWICSVISGNLAAGEFVATKKLSIHFFGSSTCGECAEIKEFLLYPLAEEDSTLTISTHNLDSKDGFSLLARFETFYGISSSSPQMLFVADTFLTGVEQIMNQGEDLIYTKKADPSGWVAPQFLTQTVDSLRFRDSLRKKFQGFTFLGILFAGLADGVNPCAIATMIFLISFLATRKRSRSEILTIGLCFTGAVFCTYLLLGLGAFKALSLLSAYVWISLAIKWTAVGVAGILSLICFRDALVYKQTGKTTEIKLQLPKKVKLQIHKVISGNLSGRRLVIGAILTGFLVTLLEAVCTGQVYLPTIVLMTRESGLQLTGWLYLLFYNFLFVLPLLIVMLLAWQGLRWDQLSKTTQARLPLIKTVMGTVLLLLAVFLAVAG